MYMLKEKNPKIEVPEYFGHINYNQDRILFVPGQLNIIGLVI